MTEFGGDGPTRVLLRQALGADEFLRVTWHEHNDVFVFSHWDGDTCVAATPIRVSELGDLATLVVTALGRIAATDSTRWPAPSASDVVSIGLRRPA